MPNKNGPKKNKSLVVNAVETDAAEPQMGSVCTSRLKIGIDGKAYVVPGVGETFQWLSGASWSSTLFAPIHEPRTEQLFLSAQKSLCSMAAFREEVSRIRRLLPWSSNDLQNLIDAIADRVCETWNIPRASKWVASLITHWDPDTEEYPPRNCISPSEGFAPWTIEVKNLRESDEKPAVCTSVTITLRRGISGREARRVVDVAQKQLDRHGGRNGRPPLSDREREALRMQFEKFGIPKSQQRKAMILKVQQACTQSGNRKLSVTLIGREMRQWLIEKNQPVKRYVTEPSHKTRIPS
ncbi:MAG: hypothetical protein QM771_05930 [Nitrospira sp.]